MIIRQKKLLISIGVLVIAVGIALAIWKINGKPADSPAPPAVQSPAQQTEPPQTDTKTPSFNKQQYSLDAPDSLWVIVNKKRPLPASYAPAGLTGINGANMRTEAVRATEQLIEAAKKDGVQLKVISGYRSYASQQSVYNRYVQNDGQTAADTYSARPGHSEHQTGLAADLGNTNGQCDLEICFSTTPGGKWLAAHAHEYGFTIRYMENKTPVTGYQYEPWHIRYLGKELAGQLQSTGQTMEEFFGLPAAPGY